MLGDYFALALNNLRSRGLRSWLTMLGIFVGIAAVVSLISLGQGLQNYINEEFQRVGVNRLIIVPGGGDAAGVMAVGESALASAKLTEGDFNTVRNIRGVETGTAILRRVMNVGHRGQTRQTTVMGVDFSRDSLQYISSVDFFELSEGRYPQSGEKHKSFIGHNLAADFDEPVNRGARVSVQGESYEIVGINKRTGQPQHDNKLVIPIEDLRRIYEIDDEEVSIIFLEARAGQNITALSEEVKRALRRSRNVKEGEEDFNVQTAQQILESFNSVIGVVQAVLGGIAAISLIVGGLGIMTTMYTSVIERTSQIGIMKALGAKNSDIRTLFLIESGMLGMAGGLIGVFLGLLISYGASYVAMNYYGSDLVRAYAGWELVIGALAFSFFIGSLSGLFPSVKAANMNPVDSIGGG